MPGTFPLPADGDNDANLRAIIVVDLDRVADSCGYAVPVMELAAERDVLIRSAENKTADELAAYRAEKNAVSIDGLPALGSSAAPDGSTAPALVTSGTGKGPAAG